MESKKSSKFLYLIKCEELNDVVKISITERILGYRKDEYDTFLKNN